MLSPVWTLESCVLETDMNLDGWRRQLRAVRMSADINVDFLALIPCATVEWFMVGVGEDRNEVDRGGLVKLTDMESFV
jgi:hypothetical protein